jgi:predicted RNA polymerase sigma factor
MVNGPAKGLEMLSVLDEDPRLSGHYRLDAVRGHFFEMAGDFDRAIAHFRAAAQRTASIPERNFLATKAARLSIERGHL